MLSLVAWIGLLLIAGQGLLFAISPRRGVAMTLWKYRLIGARPAPPSAGTLILYRVMGVAMLAVVAYILIQLVSE